MGEIASNPLRAWRYAIEKWRESAQMRHCIVSDGARVLPSGKISNLQQHPEAITIGSNSWIAGELLVFSHAGRIRVGDFCYVGDHARIWSARDVTIGHRVFLAHGVNIHDNDAHSTSAKIRHQHFRDLASTGISAFVEDFASAPVMIEDDAWVGFNSTILKGICIGQGAIVGACSLVTRDVSPFTIVAGNPAMVIGYSRP